MIMKKMIFWSFSGHAAVKLAVYYLTVNRAHKGQTQIQEDKKND